MEQRLQLFLQMEQLSQSQFADKMGIQRSGVTHLLSGRNKPSFEFITRMLQAFPSLNAEWLILGKGKPYKDSSVTPAADSISLQEPEIPAVQTDLFATPEQQQTEAQTSPSTEIFDFGNTSQSVENETKPQSQVLPKQPKTIKSILILYEDGTYEKR
jgi:transcriptional regulator with XRE-family HTH domain